jgi:dTDP-glucose pyrophosphorylase/CBS domain-containing protein
MKNDISAYIIRLEDSLRQTMSCIDKNGSGIAFIVDDEMHLLGTLSDGDVRRAILKGLSLDVKVSDVSIEREKQVGHGPITAPLQTSHATLLRLMNDHGIRHIPIIDDQQRLVDVASLTDFAKEYELPLTAVVMAGGFGSRLRPLTDNTPKPMLHVGDRPILQRTVERLKKSGINKVNLTTHYKAEAISDHFGDGSKFGVAINYVHEDQPLGTAGALSLLQEDDDPLLVINGDIVTEVDFRSMLNYHRENRACLTVGVRQYDLQVPYGVLECEGPAVRGVSEKPKLQFLVNAGVYLLEAEAKKHIPSGRRFDMTDLIQALIKANKRVVSFPIVEYWLDVGQRLDYERAVSDHQNGRYQS